MQIKIAKIGNRRRRDEESRVFLPPTSAFRGEESEKIFSDDIKPVNIARPRLVVVAGYLYSCGIYEMLENEKVKARSIDVVWGDSIIQKVENGSIDLAVYNKNAVDKYLSNKPDSALTILTELEPSMGGENFAVTVRPGHPLLGKTPSEIKNLIHDYKVVVGKTTDRYINLLRWLDADSDFSKEIDKNVVDWSDPDSRIFQIAPDALIMFGQNARVAARLDGYKELTNFDLLIPNQRNHFIESAKNYLICSESFVDSLNIGKDDLVEKFNTNMGRNGRNSEFVKEVSNLLKNQCFLDYEQESFDCEKIVEHILFETYRIGKKVIFDV
ncbi:hypothetical protein [Rothia sp. ZJ932]|uniref:hypothetical protein n=1 Tax=Rothia sp. ZJ932 TaxID=2810516 RepID=UPI001967CB11|nr:hypothetical protein [Rothia sp. ZJ932]QRZ60811.1 hypothetical protein JR346_05820 [Rothia sp. ZJ932]